MKGWYERNEMMDLENTERLIDDMELKLATLSAAQDDLALSDARKAHADLAAHVRALRERLEHSESARMVVKRLVGEMVPASPCGPTSYIVPRDGWWALLDGVAASSSDLANMRDFQVAIWTLRWATENESSEGDWLNDLADAVEGGRKVPPFLREEKKR